METQGFYKKENDEVLYAPNFVVSSEYELYKEDKQEYTLPIDGWHWFDSINDAYSHFRVPLPEPPENRFDTQN